MCINMKPNELKINRQTNKKNQNTQPKQQQQQQNQHGNCEIETRKIRYRMGKVL